MINGSRAVRSPLSQAELDEHLCPSCRIGLLLERARQIFDRGIGCTLSE